MSFGAPWLALAIVFTTVYVIALATMYAPSVRAFRM